mgnify:CR=1 FL=1
MEPGFQIDSGIGRDYVPAGTGFQDPHIDAGDPFAVPGNGMEGNGRLGRCQQGIAAFFRVGAGMGGNPGKDRVHFIRGQKAVVMQTKALFFSAPRPIWPLRK